MVINQLPVFHVEKCRQTLSWQNVLGCYTVDTIYKSFPQKCEIVELCEKSYPVVCRYELLAPPLGRGQWSLVNIYGSIEVSKTVLVARAVNDRIYPEPRPASACFRQPAAENPVIQEKKKQPRILFSAVSPSTCVIVNANLLWQEQTWWKNTQYMTFDRRSLLCLQTTCSFPWGFHDYWDHSFENVH